MRIKNRDLYIISQTGFLVVVFGKYLVKTRYAFKTLLHLQPGITHLALELFFFPICGQFYEEISQFLFDLNLPNKCKAILHLNVAVL